MRMRFLIFQPKHMLWMLKRTVSLRRFLTAPKHMFKLMDKKIIANLRKLFLLIWPFGNACKGTHVLNYSVIIARTALTNGEAYLFLYLNNEDVY